VTGKVRKLVLTTVAIAAVLAAGSSSALGAQDAIATSTSAQATAGVVVVNTRLAYGGGQTAATGIVLSSSGQVLTNNHVIRGASAIRVTDPSSARTYTATVAGYSVLKDVALLELRNARGLQTAAIGNAATLRIGDRVTSVGNAGGSSARRTKRGTVTGLRRAITVGEEGGSSTRLTGLIETSVPLRPGDSGGPLLRNGRVVGMAAAASVDFRFPENGEGFAIPIATAVAIAEQIEAGRRSPSVHVGPTAFLGVSLRQPRAFEQDTAGAIVAAVVPGSPADTVGVGSGDVITSFAGRRISSPVSLRNLVLQLAPGRVVRIFWIDDDTGRTSASVRLVSGPPQ
jgi:S1-C subfamily serine protease